MWQNRNAYRVTVGKPEIKNHTQDLGVDGRTTLKYNFKKQNGRA
jgi:hypothetical protein